MAASSSASAGPTTEWLGPDTEDTNGTAFDPRVTMNANGDGALAWWAGTELWVRLYSPGGFGSATRLNSDRPFATQVSFPTVAIDDTGRVGVAWAEAFNDGDNATSWTEAWANVYTPGVGWDGEHYLGILDPTYGEPSVAVGLGGRVFVCFLDAANASVGYQRCVIHVSGGSWLAPATLANSSSGMIPYLPRMLADAQGAVVAWSTIDTLYTSTAVYACSYTVSGGWTTPQRVDGGRGEAFIWQGRMMAGTARFIIGELNSTSDPSLYLYNWSQAGGWSAGLDLTGPDPAVRGVSLVADGGGNVTVAWTSNVNASVRDLHARYYSPAAGWGPRTLLEPFPGRVLTFSLIADSNGGAIVAFSVAGYTLALEAENVTYWARFAPGLGWLAPVEIARTPSALRALGAASSPGDALLVWQEEYQGQRWLAIYGLDRDTVPPAISYTEAPSLVNTTTVRFAGSAELDTFLFANGVEVPVNRTTAEWMFEIQLQEGDHVVGLVARDVDLNTYSQNLYVTVDTVSNLEVTAPAALSTETTSVFARVAGTAEPGATVTLDGAALSVDGLGAFSELVPLAFGLNRFELWSVDPAGNRANTTLDIIQVLPDSGIDAARAQIANLSANLTGALAELEAAQALLAAVEANATVSAADLASARVRLTLAELNVTALTASVNAANAALQQAEADAAAAAAKADAAEARARSSEGAASSASAIALAGVGLGAAGLLVGVLALLRGKKPAAPDAPPSEANPAETGEKK